MPGADVIITNEQNGETRRGVTNDVGSFTFAALAPGPYTVRAELTGFRPIMSRGITVLASSRLAVPPLVLQVGTLSEAVTVSAVAEAVATTTTSHQAVLDLSQVENLSIRGRNPISLLKILPGVSLQNNDQELFEGSFATGVPDVQGGRGQTLSVEPASSAATAATRAAAQPQRRDQHRRDRRSQRAMSAYTAEYGLKGGSQINCITKSGGSASHGSLIWTPISSSPGDHQLEHRIFPSLFRRDQIGPVAGNGRYRQSQSRLYCPDPMYEDGSGESCRDTRR